MMRLTDCRGRAGPFLTTTGRKCAVLCQQPAPRKRCLQLQVLSFKATTQDLHGVATSFPTPFGRAPAPSPASPSAILAPSLRFQSSIWYHDHMRSFHSSDFSDDASFSEAEQGLLLGPDAYNRALGDFHSAYAPDQTKTLKMWSAADDASQNVFFMFVARIQNTGSYAGCPATYSTSLVHGMYRLHLDEQGSVDSVWVFRAPTQEERSCLLKPPLLSDPVWPSILALHPCSWQPDTAYLHSIKQAAHDWAHHVLCKADVQLLSELASPDLHCYEGSGLHSGDPMTSVEAVAGDLLVKKHMWELGQVTVQALAAQDNRVFVHWRQPLTCRKSRETSMTEGTSLLVFNQHSQVIQVLDYHTPTQQDRQLLFKDGCKGFGHAPPSTGGIGPLGLSAEAMEAIARQEQEWASF